MLTGVGGGTQSGAGSTGAGGGWAGAEVPQAQGQVRNKTSAVASFSGQRRDTQFFHNHIILNRLYCFFSYACSN